MARAISETSFSSEKASTSASAAAGSDEMSRARAGSSNSETSSKSAFVLTGNGEESHSREDSMTLETSSASASAAVGNGKAPSARADTANEGEYISATQRGSMMAERDLQAFSPDGNALGETSQGALSIILGGASGVSNCDDEDVESVMSI